MSGVVWKFILPVEDEFVLAMPAGAKVVHVDAQGEQPCLWAICDPDAEREPRQFFTRGTGHALGDVGEHIGSYQLRGGAFVGHVFEERIPF